MDTPEWTCKTCRYSGPGFEMQDRLVCECRFQHPSHEGFPIVNQDAWCWDGRPGYDKNATIGIK
jgi:hypothetical protein